MILCNLLDKICRVDDDVVKIVAVYERGYDLMFLVAPVDGRNLRTVKPSDISFNVNDLILYAVRVTWTYEKKIMAIKLYRDHSGLGLADAKNHVEQNPSFILKSHISHEEASKIKEEALRSGLSATIEVV